MGSSSSGGSPRLNFFIGKTIEYAVAKLHHRSDRKERSFSPISIASQTAIFFGV
jgi:hypothetical protein